VGSALCCGLTSALLAWLVSAGSAAMAADAPVHRCGNSYSSQPCPGGTALDVADPRSAAQQREAREASGRDAALARQMRAQRVADDRAAPQGGAANLGPVAAPPPAKAASKPHQSSHKTAKKLAKPASAPR
jgi:hypothetical protein